MPLPDTKQAFKLLDRANLSEKKHKHTLKLANEINFETMKTALKRLFTVHCDTDKNDTLKSVSVKQEWAYYSKRGYVKTKSKKETPFLNPLHKKGQISWCNICDSKIHWAKNCPHRKQQNVNTVGEPTCKEEENSEKVNIVLMTEKISDHEILL